MFYIVLCKNKGIGSILLRAAMWSRWSHAALYDSTNKLVYDSTFLQGGVKVHAADVWLAKYTARELRPLRVYDEVAATTWLEEQLGKKYDFTAIFAFPLRKNWHSPNRWFCSELCEAFRNLFSTAIFRTSANRITPHHQDIIL